jgi:intein/homing endonuclease
MFRNKIPKKDVEEYFKSDLKNASISKSHTYTTPTTVYLKITSREKVLRFYEFSSEELDKNKIEAIRKKINELKRSIISIILFLK